MNITKGPEVSHSIRKCVSNVPKVLVIVRVWEFSQQCEKSQTLNLRFKRPKLWDIWKVNSEFGTFHIVAKHPKLLQWPKLWDVWNALSYMRDLDLWMFFPVKTGPVHTIASKVELRCPLWQTHYFYFSSLQRLILDPIWWTIHMPFSGQNVHRCNKIRIWMPESISCRRLCYRGSGRLQGDSGGRVPRFVDLYT